MRRRPWHFLAVLLASLPSACVGTSTGNPVKPPDGTPVNNETGGDSCDQTTTKLADLNAASPLGFSAADLLALAQANAETTIEWSNRGGVTFGPETGAGTLTVDIEPRDTPARFVDRRPKSSRSGGGTELLADLPDIGGVCDDTLELDVSVQLSTSGGALDEHFDATLRAKGANVVRMYVSRKAADLMGSLEASLASDPKATLESVIFDVAFSELGPSGTLGLGFVQPASGNSNVASATNVPPIAHWPAGPSCEQGSFGARIDQKLDGFSLQDGSDKFNAAGLQLSAAGSAPTALHVTFAPTGSPCALLEPSFFGGGSEPIPSISVDGQLTLRSDDGRIDGKWPVKLRAGAAANGGLGEVFVGFDLHGSIIASLVDATAFESTYGMHGFDMSGYDQAGIVLTLRVGPGAAASGEITVNGVRRPECQTQPANPVPDSGSGSQGQSTPGCAGLSFTPVWTAAITPKS